MANNHFGESSNESTPMPWSEEDWLIIDSALNSIAKCVRRLEQDEKRQEKRARLESAEPSFSPIAGDSSCASSRVEILANRLPDISGVVDQKGH